MAQFGDHHITIRTRGGQSVTFDSEFGAVKMELQDAHDPQPRDTVWFDEHEINAVAAWLIGWAKAREEVRLTAIANHPSDSTWTPRKDGSLGS